MRIILLAVAMLFVLFCVRPASAQTAQPWHTYECVGEPASTSQAATEVQQDWPLVGSVGDDLVMCREIMQP